MSISNISYEPKGCILEVRFQNGGIYHYFEVPKKYYAAFLTAPSKGAFLNYRIKPHFHYVKVEDSQAA